MMSNRLLALLCVAVAIPGAVSAENWPQWRGPRGNGTSMEKNIASTWSPTQNVAWRLDLPGSSGATPVVWGNQIFLTSADEDKLVLICLGTDGKQQWVRQVGTGNRTARGDEGNFASPSPVTDGKHVWTLMGSGDMACFDVSGQPVWHINLQERYGRFNIQFGMSSTPLLDGDRLYLQIIHGPMRGEAEPAYVVALDKATGKQAWKHDRKTGAQVECKHSYASPVLYDDGKSRFLLTHGADFLVAHRLDTGSELWRMGGLNGTPGASTPARRPAGNFLQRFDVAKFDTNKDGKVVRSEIKTKLFQRVFDRMAKQFKFDPGRTYTVAALRKAIGQKKPPKPAPAPSRSYHRTLRFVASPAVGDGLIVAPSAKRGPVIAIRPHAKLAGNLTADPKNRLWMMSDGTPDVPSPLIHGGLVYLCSENGNLSCFDAKTGKQQYLQRTHRMRHRASPVIADGKIYLSARDGKVTVVQAGRTFKILAQNDIEEPLASSPVISNGTLYLRTFDALWAIRAK
ncbi:MAG: PQQ-binding-like beta-propeller repeat protein [Planctomycetaceae bacterium]|nr:PQQ-binding-like beta-propeller repeat protein [Planctomycetaceae bacterium]